MSGYVIAVVDDLFFASKIRGTAEQQGVNVRFAKTVDDVLREAVAQTPALVIVDLHSQRCDPIELAKSLKSRDELKAIPVLGFFSHVQTELQRQAEEAGFDRVIPRSAFAKHLPEILLGKND
jgi:PleD family two-component response regulator